MKRPFSLSRESRNKVIMTLFFLFMSIVMLFPLLWAFSTSLKTDIDALVNSYSLIPLDGIHFENYREVFSIIPYLTYLSNTVYVSLITIGVTLVTSSLAAYAFSRLHFNGREALFLLYLATLMIPKQVVLIPNFIILKKLGLLNNLWSLILTSSFTAYGTFFLRQFFKTLPVELEESAIIDGLGYWKRFLLIVIPLSKTALVTITIITLLNTWNDYLFPLVFINTDTTRTLTVGLSLIRGDFNTRWNILMAATLLSIAPLVVSFCCAQRSFIEGIALSGIKA
jgi:multiple sugar transport system permease protein